MAPTKSLSDHSLRLDHFNITKSKSLPKIFKSREVTISFLRVSNVFKNYKSIQINYLALNKAMQFCLLIYILSMIFIVLH